MNTEDTGPSTTKISDRNAVRETIPEEGIKPALARVLATGREWFGGNRFEGVTAAMAAAISPIRKEMGREPILLDFGCGNLAISSELRLKGLVSTVWGIDTYAPPSDDADKYAHYIQLGAGRDIPFPDQHFDLAITVDVLHHAGIEEAVHALRELARVSRYVLVKDHFEYGKVTRHLLRAADWYGNYAYGVNVPDRYYDTSLWKSTIDAAGLREMKRTCPVQIHKGLFGAILPARCHFTSLLTGSDGRSSP